MEGFIIMGVIVIGVILYNALFSHKALVKRKLKKAYSKPIAQFKEGEVAKMVGEIHLVAEPLVAPLSKRPCAYYTIHVEKKVSSGDSSRWETLLKEKDFTNFLISDGGFYAMINSGNLKTYIVEDKNYNSGFWEGATKDLEDFLTSRGHDSKGFLGFNKTIRYAEGVLEKGEQVAVYGKGNWRNAEDLGLPSSYGKVLEIKPDEKDSVYLSDATDTTEKNIKRLGEV